MMRQLCFIQLEQTGEVTDKFSDNMRNLREISFSVPLISQIFTDINDI